MRLLVFSRHQEVGEVSVFVEEDVHIAARSAGLHVELEQLTGLDQEVDDVIILLRDWESVGNVVSHFG